MLSTIQITSAMFPELHEAILHDWNPRLSRDEWQQAFVPRWPCDEEHYGYALADGGRIVGMLGMLFSQRVIAGRTMRFCNLHCWHVQPEYRSKSLALMKPILELSDYTVTDFTPNPAAGAIARRLGFKPLDATVLVLPPILANGNRARATTYELTGNEDPRRALLTSTDRQIFEDHQGIDCCHMLARVGNDYCYLVYSRIAPNRLPYALVYYLSNPALFAEQHAAIRSHLLNHGKSQFVAVEERILAGNRVPLVFRSSANEKLVRGNTAAPHEIDTLYSEMVLFKHSPLPSLRHRLSTTVKRCLPTAVQRYVGIKSPA